MKIHLAFSRISIVLMLLITGYVSAQFTSSNLPIVVITTDGGIDIVDEPKVPGSIKIIDRGAGQTNFLTDVDNPAFINYSGRIGIEFRGNTSQIPDKKPYGFDTMTADDLKTVEVSLLGISKGDDWILNNLSFDPSMMHDFIAYNLARKMGNYAVSTVYCEVVVNGDYRGLYILQEKPKRKRVGVSKIEPTDVSGINLTGGYLTEVDRPDPGMVPAWSMESYISGAQNFVHITPKPEEIVPEQNAYIESVFRDLESKATDSDAGTGYPSVIDVPSFIDYMIVGELGSSCDVYTFSTKFYKDRGGKLIAGPVWDFNLGFGTDMLFDGAVPGRSVLNQWQFNNSDNQGPKFFKDLYNRSTYRCYMAKRFNELSAPNKPLNVAYLHNFIDSTAVIIQAATARDYERWGTEMPFKRKSFNEEITYLKNFISQRSAWMTTTLGSFTGCVNTTLPNVVINEIMYSPKASTAFTNADAQEFIEIKNAGSTVADLTGVYFRGVGLGYQFPPNTTLAPGQIIVLASNATTFEAKYGFAPFGQYALNLNNTSQTLTLSAPFGETIDKVVYSDKAPWPNAKGNAKSLELINATLDNSLGSNWFTSTTNEGSPGAENNFIPTPVASVSVSPTTASILVGGTQQLTATVLPANATNKSVNWTSSDNNIATVSTAGLVTGTGAGEVVITATSVDGSFTATSTINVSPIVVTSIETTSPAVTMLTGGTYTLTTLITPGNATNKKLIYTSNNESVATVSATGVISAITQGNAIITTTSEDGGFTALSEVTVNTPPGVVINVKRAGSTENPKIHVWSKETGKDISVTNPSNWPANLPNMTAGTNGWFTYAVNKTQVGVLFRYASKQTPDFKYFDKNIWISLDANGNIIGTPSFTNPDIIIPAQSVNINPSSFEVSLGGSVTITPTVLPSNASNKNITWSSSNNSVATVNNTGVVTGVAVGNATITATTVDGGFTATSQINVKSIPVEGITITTQTVSLAVNSTHIITASVFPVNASNKNVIWTSSNATIASVNNSGTVTALSVGNAVITATTVDGGFSASAQITVTPVQGITISVKRANATATPKIHVWSKETGIDIGVTNSSNWPNNLPNMTAGTNGWFTYTVNKTQLGVLFRYGTSQSADFKYFNQNVWISLDANGNIIGTPSFTNPDVIVPTQSVSVSASTVSLSVGTTQSLTATVLPSNASNKNVSWSSSNTAVATVSNSGVVTAVAIGNATITATTVDGGFTAISEVTVTPPVGFTIFVKRQSPTQQNPKIHVWSKETGIDVGITNSSNWPNNLPNMTITGSGWYSYPVAKSQFGFLFRYSDKQTVDYKYYSKNVWVLLDANGNTVSITDNMPVASKEAVEVVEEAEKVFTVSPNPVSSNFTVNYSTGKEESINLNIYSLTGQLLYTESFQTTVLQKEFNAQNLRLSSGTYIVQAQSASGVETKKIIVE